MLLLVQPQSFKVLAMIYLNRFDGEASNENKI